MPLDGIVMPLHIIIMLLNIIITPSNIIIMPHNILFMPVPPHARARGARGGAPLKPSFFGEKERKIKIE